MTIRAGVVGLGFMGSRYVAFLQKLDGVEVRAVCDVRSELAEELARQTGSRAVPDPQDLAASPEVDAVFVCTPEDHHVEASLAALEAGKAVLIEKPVAHTLEAGQAILAAARRSSAVAMVGHLLRFEPRWAAARRAIEVGSIGEVVSIATRRVGNVLDQRILDGRTTIPLYYGVHDLDVLRWLAGAEVETLYAARRAGVLEQAGYPLHDLYCAVLAFESGVLATAELGWHIPAAAATAPTSGFSVVGTEGWLKVEQVETGLQIWSETGAQAVHPVIDVTFWPEIHGVPGGALASELNHFLSCVSTGARPLVSIEDGLEALRLSLAMEAAAERNETIRMAEFGRTGD